MLILVLSMFKQSSFFQQSWKVFLVTGIAMGSLGLFGNKNKGDDRLEERRQEIQVMHDEVLEMLEEHKPDARKEVKDAPGYAVFSNVGVNVIFASFAGGKGMVVDNKTGEKTYMSMGSAGVGLGLGAKDFRAVFVFLERDKMESFIKHGWDFSGQADAAAQSNEKGGSAEVSGSALPGVKVYQITKNGLALQATLQGTKYWKSERLNN